MRPGCDICSLLALLMCAGATLEAQGGTALLVGSMEVGQGEKRSSFLEIPAGIDEGTRIPVTVVNGARPGPTVALIAGTHGYEYPPILALQRIRRELEPADLSGILILVHVANVPSFLGRTVYYSPIDGKNLNRSYPGDPNGSVSERIAHAITTEVIDKADYVVDMHGGDGNEALRPYTYWTVTGNEQLDEASRQMALAFGLDHIVIDEARPDRSGPSVYTDMTALRRAKPAITTETGGLGSVDEDWVGLAERGVWNLLRHFEMVAGAVDDVPVVWLENYEVVSSPVTGMFIPAVREGYAVAEGGLLGTITDMFGDRTHDVTAPFPGVVNYVLGTPPVREGEPLAMVSRIRAGG